MEKPLVSPSPRSREGPIGITIGSPKEKTSSSHRRDDPRTRRSAVVAVPANELQDFVGVQIPLPSSRPTRTSARQRIDQGVVGSQGQERSDERIWRSNSSNFNDITKSCCCRRLDPPSTIDLVGVPMLLPSSLSPHSRASSPSACQRMPESGESIGRSNRPKLQGNSKSANPTRRNLLS